MELAPSTVKGASSWRSGLGVAQGAAIRWAGSGRALAHCHEAVPAEGGAADLLLDHGAAAFAALVRVVFHSLMEAHTPDRMVSLWRTPLREVGQADLVLLTQ